MAGGVLVYDDDCGFCTWAARTVASRSDVEIVGFSAVDTDLAARLPADYEDCAHFLDGDRRWSCGAALEEAALRTDVGAPFRRPVTWLRRHQRYVRLREEIYRWIAAHRPELSRIVSRPPPARHDEDGT
ncbi:MAG: DCC1-like thiol-disulfide oxidoreductase family protein [Halobacteriaceae archaeon]